MITLQSLKVYLEEGKNMEIKIPYKIFLAMQNCINVLEEENAELEEKLTYTQLYLRNKHNDETEYYDIRDYITK